MAFELGIEGEVEFILVKRKDSKDLLKEVGYKIDNYITQQREGRKNATMESDLRTGNWSEFNLFWNR